MKKSFFLWGIVFISAVFVWVVSISFKGNGHFYPENSFQEVIKKKEEKQSFYLYLGRKDCKECQRVTKKIARQSQSLPMDVYYVDTKEETQQDLLRQFLSNYQIKTVPTFLEIKRGKVRIVEEKVVLPDGWINQIFMRKKNLFTTVNN
ncbi:thioredoxin [Enterococcus faecium]|uniref:thioredoxin n=1 Tax=Enterococcus faecium TaxID=1352 RepID=UPI000F502BBF|nr:thioredoxin [Enterococcus faecium]ROX59680.1 thioredoxin [Enterococcus faecium]ROX60701.1 thioredoxin [Enterococcus faecium]ROY20825.1 thioredoxin [Enterococcus faecium]ROY54807.1 thioredoxin [Enterococcus faecium]ROY71625.1 thioredoxin [Enterococcus faecium]